MRHHIILTHDHSCSRSGHVEPWRDVAIRAQEIARAKAQQAHRKTSAEAAPSFCMTMTMEPNSSPSAFTAEDAVALEQLLGSETVQGLLEVMSESPGGTGSTVDILACLLCKMVSFPGLVYHVNCIRTKAETLSPPWYRSFVVSRVSIKHVRLHFTLGPMV